MTHKAVFLNRTITLAGDAEDIQNPGQLKLPAQVGQSLAMLKKMGYLLVIVTNQPGIAHGLLTEKALEKVHHHLKKLLADQDVYLDAIVHCPYHPEGSVEQFRHESDMRLPQPGMLLKAAKELDIDLTQSWMIGDAFRDVAAGNRAGCSTILLDTPGKQQERDPSDPEPDKRAVNLRESVNILRMVEFQQKARTAHASRQEAEGVSAEEHTPPQTPNPPSTPEPAVATQAASEKTPVKTDTQEPKPVRPLPATSAEPAPLKPEPATAPQRPVRQSESTKADPPTQSPSDDPHPADNTHQLLEEILHRVKIKHRYDQYDEFSVFMLLAWLIQALAVFSLVVSVWFGLDAERGIESVQTMIGYAVALQLLVIALLLMHDKNN